VKLPKLRRNGNAWYFDPCTGKPRRWIPLGTDAVIAMRRYQAMVKRGTPSAGTIAQIVDAFIDNPPADSDWSEGTVKQYRAWANHLADRFGDLYPDELRREDILRYLDECPRTSARGEISLLRQALERAVRRGEASDNPCIGAKPESRKRSRRKRLLSDAEVAAIRAAGCPLLRVAIDLAHLTGLRVSDLCRLQWNDFADSIQTQKTGARLRYTLSDDLRAVLDAARALTGRVSSLTVLSERGRPVTRYRLGDLWRAACDKAGVKDAQMRDMRAKAGTDADDAGQDAQKLLGHTTPATTRLYLRGRKITTVEPVRRRKGVTGA
jgi:integrase